MPSESGSVEVNVNTVELTFLAASVKDGQPPPTIESNPSSAPVDPKELGKTPDPKTQIKDQSSVPISAAPNNNSTPEPEPTVNIQEGFREDVKCSLRAIGEGERLHCNPVTLHRFVVRQMMMNNPQIKFYYIKWPSVVDYFLDWHWWLTKKFWKLMRQGTFWRFLLVVGIVVVVVVPGLNIAFLLFQSLFMLIYLISFALYVVNVCACCNNKDPWETMIRCDKLSEINYINLYIAVDLESKTTDSMFITYESARVKALLYKEKFQEVSCTIPLMLYSKDFVYLYKEVMLYGFASVLGLFVLCVVGVVEITILIRK